MKSAYSPFHLLHISQPVHTLLESGRLISTSNKCGLFFCKKGRVEVSLEGKNFRMAEGDIFIYIPFMLVHLEHISPDMEGVLLEAGFDFAIQESSKAVSIENLLSIRKHPCIRLTEMQATLLEKLISALEQSLTSEKASKPNAICRRLSLEIVKNMGKILLYEILDLYFQNQPLVPLPQNKQDHVFHNFVIALYRNFRQVRDVAFYAQLQHISPRYFSQIIKKKSGNQPSGWIAQMVIIEAKQLLEASELSIKEIATQLNFPNQSFFGKYFKQHVGVSPKEYRKANGPTPHLA